MTTDRYDAFISYNHAADDRLAPAVESGLQRLAKPWYQLRAMSVYRDVSDTGLSPSLWGTVQQHLAECGWFILFACPESAASPWVEREVTHWCDTKGIDRLLVVQTGGELVWDATQRCYGAATTALSPTLARRFASEPKYLDLRWAKAEPTMPTLHHPRFRGDIADIVAAIRGTSKEEIVGEDARLQRKARRLARTAIVTVASLVVVALIAAVVAVKNQRNAEQRAREATARQLGLSALDTPASDLDRALLLSVVAGDLDTESGFDGFDGFAASRTLLGRYSRLLSLLPVGEAASDISVRAVAISDDGGSAAAFVQSGSGTRLVRWDRERPREPMPLPLETAAATALHYVPTGGLVGGARGDPLSVVDGDDVLFTGGSVVDVDWRSRRALVTRDDDVALVDASNGGVIAAWPRSTESVDVTGAITGDRAALAVGGELVLVDADTGEVLSATALEGSPRSIDVVDDTVAVVSTDGHLSVWRPGRSPGLTLVDAGTDTARDVAITAGASRLVVVGDAGTVVVDLEAMDDIATGNGSGPLVLDPSRRYAAVGGTSLTVWDTVTAQRVVAVPDKANALAWSSCAVASTCRLVVTGEAIDVWSPSTGRRVRLADQTNAQAVAITDDGQTVVSGGWGATVAVWTLDIQFSDRTGLQITYGGGPAATDPVTDESIVSKGGGRVQLDPFQQGPIIDVGPADWMRISSAARRLVTVAEPLVRLFDLDTGGEVPIDERCQGDLIAVSPNSRLVAAHRASDGRTAVCDVASGEVVAGAVVDGAALPADAIAVDDDGSVAIGGGGHLAFHARDGTKLQPGIAVDVRFGREPVVIRAIALRRGRIAAGVRSTIDGTAPARVALWQASSGTTAVQFDTDHTDMAGVALMGDDAGMVVVAGRADDDPAVVVQLWETDSLRRVGRAFGGLTGDVVFLSGDELKVVGMDATGHSFAWLWEEHPMFEVCEIVGRPLTRDEWDDAIGGALRDYDFDDVCSKVFAFE